MKEDSFNFSLTDFLAYLFPGTVTLLAIAGIIRLSPFKQLILDIQLNLVTGLLLIAVAYFVGIILSSLTYNFEEKLFKFYKLSDPLDSIQLEGFEKNVLTAFNELFGDRGAWSRNHFYISRSLNREKMPSCAAISDRQSSLRQIRRNSLIPILILGIAGLSSGLKILELDDFKKPINLWGIALILFSILGSFIITRNLIKIGMYNNRKREVREVCTALLSFYHQSFLPNKSNATSLPAAQPNNSFNPTAR